jgi:predicted nucleic acid-binding protein
MRQADITGQVSEGGGRGSAAPPANTDLLIAAHAAALGAVLATNDPTLEQCSKPIDVRQTVNWADDVGVEP